MSAQTHLSRMESEPCGKMDGFKARSRSDGQTRVCVGAAAEFSACLVKSGSVWTGRGGPTGFLPADHMGIGFEGPRKKAD